MTEPKHQEPLPADPIISARDKKSPMPLVKHTETARAICGDVWGALMEVALALGGVAATHPIEDEVVRALAGSLGAIADRHLSDRSGRSRAMAPSSSNARLQPHPAIEKLLARIGVPPAPSPAATELASEVDRHEADEEWLRLPGLFRRWEFAEVIDAGDEYLVQQAGHDESGGSLFAIYSRPHAGKEEAP